MKQPSTQQTSIVLNQANVDSVGFNIKIFQDAAEINYLSYSGAEMVFLKPDKNNVVDDNVILSSAGIGYTLRPELFQAPGMITGYVNLYSGEVIAATLYFKFMVVSDLLKLETISKSYLAVIERLFSDVSNLWNVMDQLSAEMEAIREKIDSI
jgi:hypothetical protein